MHRPTVFIFHAFFFVFFVLALPLLLIKGVPHELAPLKPPLNIQSRHRFTRFVRAHRGQGVLDLDRGLRTGPVGLRLGAITSTSTRTRTFCAFKPSANFEQRAKFRTKNLHRQKPLGATRHGLRELSRREQRLLEFEWQQNRRGFGFFAQFTGPQKPHAKCLQRLCA